MEIDALIEEIESLEAMPEKTADCGCRGGAGSPTASGDAAELMGVTALETLIALGVIAANTQRVRFGLLILPLRNPVASAHPTVTLDRLCGGRLVLGVGAGGESQSTFDAYSVAMNERGRRCDQMLDREQNKMQNSKRDFGEPPRALQSPFAAVISAVEYPRRHEPGA